MKTLDCNSVNLETLELLSDIETELYQFARHSSLLLQIDAMKHWLKFGDRQNVFKHACMIDGKTVLDACTDVLENIGFSAENLFEYTLSKQGCVGESGYYGILFKDDEAPDRDDDESGDGSGSRPVVTLHHWTGKRERFEVTHSVFFHALRTHLITKGKLDLATEVSRKYRLSDESSYLCEPFTVLPSFLHELQTELIMARTDNRQTFYGRIAISIDNILFLHKPAL
ncbi:hypothetical protein L3V77_11145 [Vibrio sp. DW001]|uniref:hypothetical protein n=1 Tax=Vibrio sp. DW001 TaxID=2912315 RepID=UPI0023B00F60|nr:hypothetical protein [Vibrio sp. DW001]WED25619.1 hypothetical protein L3V77_11145 [Vibrio sp. DW001]